MFKTIKDFLFGKLNTGPVAEAAPYKIETPVLPSAPTVAAKTTKNPTPTVKKPSATKNAPVAVKSVARPRKSQTK